MYTEASTIAEIIAAGQHILIVQADNPDADSLGSALALEHILGDMGKEPRLYCAVDMPGYLRYMSGWDRVSSELPSQFDTVVIVDASTMTLLERAKDAGHTAQWATRPTIVLDHHQTVENPVHFAKVTLNDPARSSAGELLWTLAGQLDWPRSVDTAGYVMSAILGDTQGLTNQLASVETYRIMADMIEQGVNRPALEDIRREYSKMPAQIYRYKGKLLQRTDFVADGRIATVTIPQNEINEYSPLYNPGPLVQGDMLQTQGVQVAIVFKSYDDGKVTAAIRCNASAPIGNTLADAFGGGGHVFASGFKVVGGRPFNEIRSECLAKAETLLNQL